MGSLPVNLSASRGSAILGISKYKSSLIAWLEIMEERNPGFCNAHGYKMLEKIDPWETPYNPDTAPLRWGLAFENSICALVGGITDREKLFIHPDHDFLTCHIDGLKNVKIQENKTAYQMAFNLGWGEPGSDMIPIDYQAQVQHQAACSGIKEIDVNVLVFPKSPKEWEDAGYEIDMENKSIISKTGYSSINEFACSLFMLGFFYQYHVKANKKVQKEMIDRYLLFWNDNVLKEVPPPVNGYNDIKWLIPSPEGEIEADERIRELWAEYCDITTEAESGKERCEQIKNEFAKFIQKNTPKESAEKGKLIIYAGSRKLVTMSAKQFRVNTPKKEKGEK